MMKIFISIVLLIVGQSAFAAPYGGSSSASIDDIDIEVSKSPSVLSLAMVASEKKDFTYGQDDGIAHLGVGALYEVSLSESLGIESGVLYIKRQYKLEAADVKIINEVSRLHIPVLFKYWVSNYFSIGVGPYLGFNLGDAKTNVVVGDQETTLESSADEDLDFGYEIAAAFNYNLSDGVGLFLDGRYSQQFEEKASEDYEKIMGLAGIKIAI